jgi:hypothetical protein
MKYLIYNKNTQKRFRSHNCDYLTTLVKIPSPNDTTLIKRLWFIGTVNWVPHPTIKFVSFTSKKFELAHVIFTLSGKNHVSYLKKVIINVIFHSLINGSVHDCSFIRSALESRKPAHLIKNKPDFPISSYHRARWKRISSYSLFWFHSHPEWVITRILSFLVLSFYILTRSA